jgi:hypothetical protein
MVPTDPPGRAVRQAVNRVDVADRQAEIGDHLGRHFDEAAGVQLPATDSTVERAADDRIGSGDIGNLHRSDQHGPRCGLLDPRVRQDVRRHPTNDPVVRS